MPKHVNPSVGICIMEPALGSCLTGQPVTANYFPGPWMIFMQIAKGRDTLENQITINVMLSSHLTPQTDVT